MKVAIVIDANSNGGGGYYQSLRTLEILKIHGDKNFDYTIIATSKKIKEDLKKRGFQTLLFNQIRWANIYSKIISSVFLISIISKLRIKNPFSKFLKKNDIEFIYFLGPSNLINVTDNFNYAVNIYDINHRLDNFFPEYKKNNVIDDRERIIINCVKKSFKIIVDTNRSKKEMQSYYNCSSDKIEVIPFNTFLPSYYESKKETFRSEDLNKKFDFLNKKKTFFYPAQFWAHKNHMYILEAVNLLKGKNLDFKIVFCGSDKGNYKFIKKKITELNLEDKIQVFDFLTEDEIVYLYLNVAAIIVPSYVARSTLLLYEAFYFKKVIFYSKNVLDPELEKMIIPCDLNNISELSSHLENFMLGNNSVENQNRIEIAKKFYDNTCDKKNISNKINKILNQYKKMSRRWQ